MSTTTANAVICGAGIAGVALAHQLAVARGMTDILLVDPLPPLTLTSDKSGESYRNWFPGPDDSMVRMMNRSLDMLEELHRQAPERLPMNRRGYVFATADPAAVDDMIAGAAEICALGAGELRIHRGEASDPVYTPFPAHGIFDAPWGADILLDQALIRQHFPYLTDRTVALLHTRRCGWFSAQQFGMYMLEEARAHGVELVRRRVASVAVEDGRVTAVTIDGADGPRTVNTSIFVNAAGPMVAQVGQLLGVEIPVFSELHLKVAFPDHQQAIPRDMPLIIWNDPIRLEWTDAERAELEESDETRWMTAEMPGGVHGRSEGESCLLQWDYHGGGTSEPVFPLPNDPRYPEMALRGMATVIPSLAAYLERIPKAFVDGGYYTRTEENRPLIGPLPVDGAYIIGAFGGFGMQVACGAAELLAGIITGGDIPDYAPVFALSRYADPAYQQLLARWGASGQI